MDTHSHLQRVIEDFCPFAAVSGIRCVVLVVLPCVIRHSAGMFVDLNVPPEGCALALCAVVVLVYEWLVGVSLQLRVSGIFVRGL